MLTRPYLLQTTMTRGRSLFKPCSLETRSSSGTYSQDPCSHIGQDCIQSSSPPQPQQNCWDISPGYILTTLNEYQPRTSGPPKWWAQPNCGWYVLLILTLLPTLTEAADCSQCMRGIGKDCYSNPILSCPRTVTREKLQPHALPPMPRGKTFWTSVLNTK